MSVVGVPFMRAAPMDTHAVLVIDAGAELRDLAVEDCEIGVLAHHGAVSFTRVTIDQVRTGIFSDGAPITLESSVVRTGNGTVAAGSNVPDACLYAIGGGLLLTIDTRLEGHGTSFGVVASDRTTDLGSTTLTGHTVGLFLLQGTAGNARLHDGTSFSDFIPITGLRASNVIQSGHLDAADISFSRIPGVALSLDAVEGASLARASFSGIEDVGIVVVGSELAIAESVTLTIPDGGVGLGVQGGLDLDGTTPRPAHVTISAPLAWTAGDALGMARHIAILGGGTVDATAPLDFTGGITAVYAQNGGIARLATVTTRLSFGAIVSSGAMSSVHMDSIDLTPEADDESAGLAMFDGGSVTVSGGAIHGAGSGVLAVRGGSAEIDNVMIDVSRRAGVWWGGGGTLSLSGTSITSSQGLGVLVDGPATATLDTSDVLDPAGVGIEAHAGATLTVRACHVRNAAGAAVAFHDSQGAVTESHTEGTRLTDIGGEQRADEIRITDDDPAIDAGDVMIGMSGFTVATGRHCDPDRCTVILATGAGSHGVVTPNCLTASDPNLFTALAQNGGSITTMGDASWLNVLAMSLTTPATVVSPPLPASLGAAPTFGSATVPTPPRGLPF